MDALRYLLRKGRGSAEIRKVLGYFRNNRSRMNYYELAEEGYPIGSGEVEAANKMITGRSAMLHDSLMASTRAQVLYTGQKFPIGKKCAI